MSSNLQPSSRNASIPLFCLIISIRSDMSIVETASNESDAEHLGISVVEDMLWARRSFLCVASRHSPVGTGYPPLSLPLPCWGPGWMWAMAGWHRRRRLRFTGCGCQVGFQCPLPRLNWFWILFLLLHLSCCWTLFLLLHLSGGVTIFIYIYAYTYTHRYNIYSIIYTYIYIFVCTYIHSYTIWHSTFQKHNKHFGSTFHWTILNTKKIQDVVSPGLPGRQHGLELPPAGGLALRWVAQAGIAGAGSTGAMGRQVGLWRQAEASKTLGKMVI